MPKKAGSLPEWSVSVYALTRTYLCRQQRQLLHLIVNRGLEW